MCDLSLQMFVIVITFLTHRNQLKTGMEIP